MAHEMFWTIIFGFHYYENEPLWFRNVGNAKKASRHFREIPLCYTRDRNNSLDLQREMIYFKMYSFYRFVYRRGQVVVYHFIASLFPKKRTVWCKRDFLLQSDFHMSEDDVPRKIGSLIIMVLLYLYCHRPAVDEYFHCLWRIHIWYLGRDNFRYFIPSNFFALDSPGHNQNWIYDDVTEIFNMAPKPRETIQGHFSALCYA